MICNGAPALTPELTRYLDWCRTVYSWNLAMMYAGCAIYGVPTLVPDAWNDHLETGPKLSKPKDI